LQDPAVALSAVRFAWPGQAGPCLGIEAFAGDRGESVFVHGDSGSGKSTLLALLGGVLVPQPGAIHVLGTDLARLPAGRRDRFRVDHVGFVFPQFNLIPYLSMRENVLLPCRFSGRRRARSGARLRSPPRPTGYSTNSTSTVRCGNGRSRSFRSASSSAWPRPAP
jgi:putative ABC transport system ATP-binding protein